MSATLSDRFPTMAHMDRNKMICVRDRINELPEEILVSILSFLTPKEAARTSVLSSKWRYLWLFFVGRMLFNKDEWQINWSQLVTQINHIMTLHRGMNLEEFTVDFDNVDSVEDTDHWIEFAAKKKVKKLRLIFGKKTMGRFFGTIQLQANLNLESLKVLRLENATLRHGAMVNGFLLSCPNLKELYMRDLHGASNPLLVPSSCSKLKILHVVRCQGLKKVDIFATSIEEFRHVGYNVDIQIKELHQLHHLRFADRNERQRDISDQMAHLFRILPIHQLKELTLEVWTRKQWSPLNVKQFGLPKLECLLLIMTPSEGLETLSWMYLLEMAPVLHTLKIHLYWELGFIKKMVKFHMHRMRVNRCIKVVKIEQFVGLIEVDIEIVKIVIKYVESLEKLIVVPYSEIEGSRLPILTDGMKKQINDNIAQLREKAILPSRVELVIERELDS